MLISEPVLGQIKAKESSFGGRYPLGVFMDSKHEGLVAGWHGGLHLEVPPSTGGATLVRAIADGTVVAYRVPTQKPREKEALEKHILNYGGTWTDDGFVLLKHEKEYGEGRPVVFYSLYMHLSKLEHRFLQKGTAGEIEKHPKTTIGSNVVPAVIKRKESIGHAGTIDGQPHQIHFEIFAGDEDFQKFFKSCQGSMDPWGELYFVIPEGHPVYAEKPTKGQQPQAIGSTPGEWTIGLRYLDGNALFRSVDENGFEIASWTATGHEYELYKEADSVDRDRLSRVYELLRFGQVMKWPDLKNDPDPRSPHCWHYLPMVGGWLDFADSTVRKYSDADFLEHQWKRVPMGEAGFDPTSGLCQAGQLLSALDENGNGNLSDTEFKKWNKTEVNRALLRRMAVQFQSEWDSQAPDIRWGWVKRMWANPVQHETQALKTKLTWVAAQKESATKALPSLKERAAQAKGWHSQVSTMKAEADRNLAAALQAQTDARKAKDDFIRNVDGQQTQVGSPSSKAVITRRTALTKAVDKAMNTRKAAEVRVRESDSMLASAEAWVAREEAKLQAAGDTLALAEPLMAELQKNLEATSKKPADPSAASQAETDFKLYKGYMKALQFWDQVPGLPDSKVWHFHPLAFVEFFKKCHWLSKGELEAIYPSTPKDTRETYRLALNRVMWKYGITTPARMSHFFGQGWVESGALTNMMEKSSIFPEESAKSEAGGYYRNPHDFYYTHVQRYENLSWGGNIEKADLRNAKGEPVDIRGEIKKSDEQLTAEIGKSRTTLAEAKKKSLQVSAQVPANQEAIRAAKGLVREKEKELRELETSQKKPLARHQRVAESTIDPAKSHSGDGMKFRGRGMKQLTARKNYTAYWVYRGWLVGSAFDTPWWDSTTLRSNGRRAPQIDDPQRVSTVPFNCIDTGGWYWEAGSRRPINVEIKEGQPIDRASIRSVSAAINGVNRKTGEPNGLDDRIKRTQQVSKVILDKVEPVP